jgi:hypothetical protein
MCCRASFLFFPHHGSETPLYLLSKLNVSTFRAVRPLGKQNIIQSPSQIVSPIAPSFSLPFFPLFFPWT